MYGFTRRARRPISREEAARTVGISRKLAAFHLDKLVEVGLLRARYEPVSGIRKVGRTPKVYEPTNTEVHISIPARDHNLLTGILIDAVLIQDQDKAGPEAALQIAITAAPSSAPPNATGPDPGASAPNAPSPSPPPSSPGTALNPTGSPLHCYGYVTAHSNPRPARHRSWSAVSTTPLSLASSTPCRRPPSPPYWPPAPASAASNSPPTSLFTPGT